jgi:ADP-heptose:LPS heptosyltransferase
MVANQVLKGLLAVVNQMIPDKEAAPLAGLTACPFHIPRRALIVPSRYIGDCVLLTPFIQNLRQNLPVGAHLDLMATATTANLFEPMLATVDNPTPEGPAPLLDRLWIEGRPETAEPQEFLERQGYDTIFFFRYAPFWEMAATRAAVPQRVGFDLERLGLRHFRRHGGWLTHTVPSGSMFDCRHQVERYLDFLRGVGLPVFDSQVACRWGPEDEQQVSRWIHPYRGRLRVLIQAQASIIGKTWPQEHWAALLEALDEQYGQPVFFAVGVRDDALIYETLADLSGTDWVNLCGRTTLRQSMALMHQVDLVISLDTSVSHLAAAAETPRLVVLYGPTNAQQWAPCISSQTVLQQVQLRLPCQPCMIRNCAYRRCMEEMTPEQVLAAVARCFSQQPLRRVS